MNDRSETMNNPRTLLTEKTMARGLCFLSDIDPDLAELGEMDTPAAKFELMKIKGIGPWTADIYLLSALRRPDIWPKGDLALAVSVQRVKNLASRPTPDELEAISTLWHPWRAVAARVLWHDYLNNTEGSARSSE